MTIFDVDNLRNTLRPWLIGHLCPFWLERTLDPRGGFFEALDADGQPVLSEKRTVLVQARITYVFSHAFMISGVSAFGEAAQHGFDFMMRFRTPDGGFARSMTLPGEPLDAARDAYDQAFALFAMSWFLRAFGDQEASKRAEETYRFMERCLGNANFGGFNECYLPGRESVTLPRRQNPHMHLLEAMLSLYTASNDLIWLRRGGDIVALFKSHFADPKTGAVIEYFNEDLSPATGSEGQWREPGHQFEWVWLLSEYFKETRDEEALDAANKLFAFGMQFGIEREKGLTRAAFDGVLADGTLAAPTKHLWPQTELIKACVARYEQFSDEHAWPQIKSSLALIANSYLRRDGASWHNQLDRNGAPCSVETPARVLYHVVLAIAEVDRLIQSTSNLEGA